MWLHHRYRKNCRENCGGKRHDVVVTPVLLVGYYRFCARVYEACFFRRGVYVVCPRLNIPRSVIFTRSPLPFQRANGWRESFIRNMQGYAAPPRTLRSPGVDIFSGNLLSFW